MEKIYLLCSPIAMFILRTRDVQRRYDAKEKDVKMKSSPPDYMRIAPGVYDAQLLSVEVVSPGPDSPFPDDYWRWEFTVFTPEFPEGIMKYGSSSANFTPKSKAKKWVEALLGRTIPDGEELDSEDWCPIDCQVVIRQQEGKDTTKIEEVFGAPKKVKRPAPAATAKGDGEDL
jgi:hypothetical protein